MHHDFMDSRYHYDLPPALIASRPASPRDAARLLVFDAASGAVSFDRFLNIDKYLPQDSLLVLNDTKVAPARAMLRKETGGNVEVLFLLNEWDGKGPIPALVDRKVAVGAMLDFGEKKKVEVIGQEENIFYLKPHFQPAEIFEILDRRGVTPIPKYIKNTGLPESVLRKRYQSIFGKKFASVAAPTASLHFTDRVIAKLEKQGMRKTFVTLHVGLGTFAPVSERQLAAHELHREFLTISAASATAIREQKRAKKPVVAVGTTVVRALESQAGKIMKPASKPISAETRIFIKPPHDFKIVDALVTNFHLPGTSLMMLVQAFLENKKAKRSVAGLYRIAIKEKFRFYSFGDTMLVK